MAFSHRFIYINCRITTMLSICTLNENTLFGSLSPLVGLNINTSLGNDKILKINMKKSYPFDINNITSLKFSFAPPACPRCSTWDTRQSKRLNGNLFNKLFRKVYRCNICYFRFRMYSPFRILIRIYKFFNY